MRHIVSPIRRYHGVTDPALARPGCDRYAGHKSSSGQGVASEGGSAVERDITYVGMDVHKETIAVAYVRGGQQARGVGADPEQRGGRAQDTMGYSGLVCDEASSAGGVRRGPLTRTGNATVWWVAVEAAHHYRHLPKVSLDLKRRQEGCSEAVREIAWRAQGRLNRRYRRPAGRGLPTPRVVAAVARELLGFVWAIGRLAAREGRAEAAVG